MLAREKVKTIRARVDSWREVGKQIGDEQKTAACHRVVNDPEFRPSPAFVEMIEQASLPPLYRKAAVCPSCLARGVEEIHGSGIDCHNNPVAAVVILAPGERVTAEPERKAKVVQRRKHYHYIRLDDAELFAELNAERLPGESWAAYLRRQRGQP